MTHIEQMIQDMCPNGVEFKTLGEVATLSRGKVYSKEYLRDNAGEYPVYSSQTANNGELGRISTYDYDGKYLTWTTDGAYAGTVFRREGRFSITNVCGLISNVDKALSIDFLYYWLNKVAKGYVYQGMGNPKLMSNVMETIEIPLLPIEIQKKIVECLNKFSALAAELQAELQLRRKQYEYYRTQLLTPHSDCNSATKPDDAQWEWKTLGEICDLVKERVSAAELNENNYVGVENLLSNKQGKIPSVSVPATGNVIKFSKDNILIGNIRPYLRKIWFADCDGGTNGDVITLSIKDEYKNLILPRFLYHALADERFFIYDTQYSSGAKMPRGDKERVMEYQIALPPLAEQARIVSILDKFKALTTSLSDGIPAEQAAQQKRYEYYRDLLLTFPKAEG